MIVRAALLLALLQGLASSAPTPARMGVIVRPDTVTVGDHFALVVRVRAPRGSEIGFPIGPDSGGAIEAVDPRTVQTSLDTTAIDQTATYRLVAWDTGGQAITIGDVVVSGGGQARRLPVGTARVYVRSVLPKDTALQVPKPARDVIPAPAPWWPWLLAAAIILALLLFLWWWLRRRRRDAGPIVLDALAEAQREFARIDALQLLEAGERGRYVALNVDVLRDYLAARLEGAARSLTSAELLDALRARRAAGVERMAPVLGEADLVKFARRPVSAARAREIARELRAIVQDVENAVIAEQQRRAAEAAAAAGGERAA